MVYTVKSGDTLWSISQSLGTTVAALEAANPGIDPNALRVGQQLNTAGGSGDGGAPTTYTVASGDTFWSIAKSHGTSVVALQAANPGVNPANLQVGQSINVPGSSGGASAISSSPIAVPGPISEGSGASVGGGYENYSGPASNFPDPATWAPFDNLWQHNSQLMKGNDNDSQIGFIRQAIDTVSQESGVDHRVILCIIMQESGGNVHVPTTDNGVRNPGIMQSHNGAEYTDADPQGSILQMVRDGTTGTKDGDGLKQCFEKTGSWYAAFRMYNSGQVNNNDLNDPVGATPMYVQSTANRLMGHIWNGM